MDFMYMQATHNTLILSLGTGSRKSSNEMRYGCSLQQLLRHCLMGEHDVESVVDVSLLKAVAEAPFVTSLVSQV